MKNLKNVFCKLSLSLLLTLVCAHAWAQVGGDSSKGQIDELKATAENMANGIKIEVKDQDFSIPDYKPVYDAFTNETTVQVGKYKAMLEDIRTTAQAELTRIETEVNAAKVNAANGDAVAKSLYEIALQKEKTSKAALSAELNDEYQEGLANLISLGGKLAFPCVKRVNSATVVLIGSVLLTTAYSIVFFPAMGLSNAAAAAAQAHAAPVAISSIQNLVGGPGGILELGLGFGTTMVEPILLVQDSQDNNPGILSGGFGFGRRVRNNLGQLISYHGHFKQLSVTAENEIFKECSTSGCVMQIGGAYQKWMDQARELNQNIDLGDGLELSALPLIRESKTDNAFWKVTQAAAAAKDKVSQ